MLFEIELVSLPQHLIIVLSLAAQLALNLVLCLYGLMESVKELFLSLHKPFHLSIARLEFLDLSKLLLRLFSHGHQHSLNLGVTILSLCLLPGTIVVV